MKIKLIDKKNLITTQTWCFKNTGFCSSVIEEINTGKVVSVDRLPKEALEYVEEVKETKNKKKGGK
jgi:hypothetical protein